MIYHVSKLGSDQNDGSLQNPFYTINHAAQIAQSGDTVQVHSGTYREWVDPKFGGTSDANRIVYEAAPDEHPIIKGSEIVTDWEHAEGSIWKKTLPNTMFGDWNPYALKIEGDWLIRPEEYDVHLGDVYINGVFMYEATSEEDLSTAAIRDKGCQENRADELIVAPELTKYRWIAKVDAESTTLYCNFQEKNPNEETIEINVRQCCFFPKKTGVNYITVRGFEIAHAATPWAPPTADQPGMVGPHWSKGWIIENNILHDSKCNGISLGKEITTGHNDHFRTLRKSGHIYQMEAVFKGVQAGWCKEKIGSHVVRNNLIYDCGQTGIVGHMGGAFCFIENNHIYNIAVKHEFWGHEIAGIKLHAAIDTVLRHNHIHHCGNHGTWLDWQAQGTRVTQNLYHDNARDLYIEVSHGPCTVDNNLFLSDVSLMDRAQGSAFVHNVFAGVLSTKDVLKRTTPYHFPHSTDVLGVSFVYGGDNRFFNNLFLGNSEPSSEKHSRFLEGYDRNNTAEEYRAMMQEKGHRVGINKYFDVGQPLWAEGNAYAGSAKPWHAETDATVVDSMSAELRQEGKEWILSLNLPEAVVNKAVAPVTTDRLGEPRSVEERYENPDGTPIDFTVDFFGNTRKEPYAGPFAAPQTGKWELVVWRDA